VGDIYQSNVIATFHRLDRVDPADLVEELRQFSEVNRTALSLPALFSEFEGKALPRILETLKEADYIDHVVLVLGKADRDQFLHARKAVSELPQRTSVIWVDSPRVQGIINAIQENELYVGEDGKEQPVAMIHRTVLGSMERFMASITEHYGGAFPRGMTPKEFAEATERFGPIAYYGAAAWSDPTRIYRQYANGEWTIEELEKLGVTMRWTDGDFRPIKGFIWGGPFLRVHWMNVKPEMAAGVRKRGVNVLERTMVVDLLTNNGTVVGATAVNTRSGEFIIIKAKAVVIATGLFSRCFDPSTPLPWKYKMRYHWCPATISGDGYAMAYRAGARIVNMEYIQFHPTSLVGSNILMTEGCREVNLYLPGYLGSKMIGLILAK